MEISRPYDSVNNLCAFSVAATNKIGITSQFKFNKQRVHLLQKEISDNPRPSDLPAIHNPTQP